MRPGLDLMAQLPEIDPARIVDLGCGTGFLTARLSERWPEAAVSGVDASPEMLANAARDHAEADWPRLAWQQGDIALWRSAEPVDLVYSNAALQWLEHHDTLFPQILGQLVPGGVLAIQMPRNFDQPSHVLLREVARSGPWAGRIDLRDAPVAGPQAYYDLLAPHVGELDIWETEYLHVLSGDHAVLDWVRGTALLPVFDALAGAERDSFVAEYSARLDEAYPKRADGKTLFPFRRLFLIARRNS